MEIANIKTTEYPVINADNTCIVSSDVIVSNCVIDENKNITGYVYNLGTKPIKSKYINSKNLWVFGKNIGRYSNLINLAERTEEERKAIYLKSQESRQANKENKKNFNELAKAMLEQTVSESQIAAVLGDNTEMLLDNSVASVILASMIKGAVEGSFKCAEFVRDTAGYKPKNEVEVSADIMTDSDRALIDKLQKRIG